MRLLLVGLALFVAQEARTPVDCCDPHLREAAEGKPLTRDAEGLLHPFAKSWARMRVGMLKPQGKLTEKQETQAYELFLKWFDEDGRSRRKPEVWKLRERELMALLTRRQIEEITKAAHEAANRLWSTMALQVTSKLEPEQGQKLKPAVEEKLKAPPAWPTPLILPRAHGANWQALFESATAKAEPVIGKEAADRIRADLCSA